MSYTNAPLNNRPAGPVTAEPVRDYLNSTRPGLTVDQQYLVLPRAVIERLPIPVQQQLVHALAQVHQIAVNAPWPVYRVGAGRWAKLADLDEGGLAEVGVIAELDLEGHLVHRSMRTGQPLSEQDLQQYVVVSAPDQLATQ
jgi:hypothetical protein